MITLRLNKKIEKEIEIIATSTGISKSEFIRKSILEYLRENKFNNSWELGKDLFGKYSSDNKSLAENSEELFKVKIKNNSR